MVSVGNDRLHCMLKSVTVTTRHKSKRCQYIRGHTGVCLLSFHPSTLHRLILSPSLCACASFDRVSENDDGRLVMHVPNENLMEFNLSLLTSLTKCLFLCLLDHSPTDTSSGVILSHSVSLYWNSPCIG
jgi:hypothetical protein